MHARLSPSASARSWCVAAHETWGDVGRCGEIWGDVGRWYLVRGGTRDEGGEVEERAGALVPQVGLGLLRAGLEGVAPG